MNAESIQLISNKKSKTHLNYALINYFYIIILRRSDLIQSLTPRNMEIKETITEQEIIQSNSNPFLWSPKELGSKAIMDLREKRIVLTGRDKFLYPMLAVKIKIDSSYTLPKELAIIAYCFDPKGSTPWLQFRLPVTDNSMTIDLWDCMKVDDCDNPESVGYYSWHYVDGLYFQFNTEEEIKYDVSIHYKEKLIA